MRPDTTRGRQPWITADEVAKQVGVSRVTAWRYLERLAEEGTV
jgi:response regulator of citrate/malate metabolism